MSWSNFFGSPRRRLALKAGDRVTDATAAPLIPRASDLASLAAAARQCQACPLYKDAEQTVFGTGPATAPLMLVGEQPGDQEDRQGMPFVGPAGRLLDKALAQAGIERSRVYLTNAVKHFKFVRAERGNRRIHKAPSRIERVACRPWLLAEIDAVGPNVLVLLGATAAKSLLGNDFRLTLHRQQILQLPDEQSPTGPAVVVTVHPSAVLRASASGRAEAFDGLVSDLSFAAGSV
jgi:DNA polymerase